MFSIWTLFSCFLVWCLLKVVLPFVRVLMVYTVGKKFSKRTYLKEAGDWAIVTGCTAGIGKAYAKELAKEGLNIMLISRDAAKLKNVAEEIESTYRVKTAIVVCDFFKTDIYEKLTEEVEKLDSIACLVNNVGVSYPNYSQFVDAEFMTLDFIRNMVNCNMNSVALMTRIVLPSMLKRNRPRTSPAIINISSFAGLYPFPYLSLYGASKSFVYQFTEALRNESINANITFQTVCPMLVASQMSKIKRTSFFVPSADVYAESALNMLGVESVTMGYFPHALQAACLSIYPKLILWVAEKSFRKCLRKKHN